MIKLVQTSLILKKLLLMVFLFMAVASINGQEKDKFRLGMDLGYVFANGGGGALFSLEPKYNLTNNSNVGLRIGSSAAIGDIERSSGNFGIVGTYDYYFLLENASIRPFLGGGLGWYILADISTIFGDIDTGGKFGAMLRGGMEYRKLRLALEYNILPKTDFGDDGLTITNSYFGMSIGFYVGGGKW